MINCTEFSVEPLSLTAASWILEKSEIVWNKRMKHIIAFQVPIFCCLLDLYKVMKNIVTWWEICWLLFSLLLPTTLLVFDGRKFNKNKIFNIRWHLSSSNPEGKGEKFEIKCKNPITNIIIWKSMLDGFASASLYPSLQ